MRKVKASVRGAPVTHSAAIRDHQVRVSITMVPHVASVRVVLLAVAKYKLLV